MLLDCIVKIKMGLKCLICMEKYSYLKYLSCRHSFCVQCLQKIKKSSQDGHEIILCPFDRFSTTLNDGINDLQTNFILTCDNCSEEASVSKFWWCKNCNDSVCSTCAMKKHRNHDCDNWEKYEIIKTCLAVLEPYKADVKEMEEKVHDYWRELEKAVKNKFRPLSECNKFMTKVEKICKTTSTMEEYVPNEKFEKILTTIAKILQYNNSDESNPFSVDIDLLKQLPGSELPKKLNFPNIDQMVDLFFEKKDSDTDSNLSFVSATDRRSLDQLNKIDVAVQTSIKNFEHFIEWSKSISVNVHSICPVPNGIVIVGENGLYTYNFNLDCVKFKTWGNPAVKPKHVEHLTAIYHHTRKSVFVVDEQTRVIMEYGLAQMQWFQLFELPDDGFPSVPFFVNVLCDGRLICIQGVEGDACIWVKSYPISGYKWIPIWDNKNMKKLLAMHIVRKLPNEDLVYVVSEKIIYEFQIGKNKTKWLRSIDIDDEQSTIYVLFNEMYYFKANEKSFVSFFQKNHLHPETDMDQKDNILFVTSDKFIYFLNCSQKVLKVGVIQ